MVKAKVLTTTLSCTLSQFFWDLLSVLDTGWCRKYLSNKCRKSLSLYFAVKELSEIYYISVDDEGINETGQSLFFLLVSSITRRKTLNEQLVEKQSSPEIFVRCLVGKCFFQSWSFPTVQGSRFVICLMEAKFAPKLLLMSREARRARTTTSWLALVRRLQKNPKNLSHSVTSRFLTFGAKTCCTK